MAENHGFWAHGNRKVIKKVIRHMFDCRWDQKFRLLDRPARTDSVPGGFHIKYRCLVNRAGIRPAAVQKRNTTEVTRMDQDMRDMVHMIIDEMARMEERIYKRFDSHESRLGRIEERLDRMDRQLDAIWHEVNANRLEKDTLVIMDKRITRLEQLAGVTVSV